MMGHSLVCYFVFLFFGNASGKRWHIVRRIVKDNGSCQHSSILLEPLEPSFVAEARFLMLFKR